MNLQFLIFITSTKIYFSNRKTNRIFTKFKVS